MLNINFQNFQTDGRTTYDSNTTLALRASRGKNLSYPALYVQNDHYRKVPPFG